MIEPEDGDGAAEAFDSLRAEIALLRRAIEGLAAERNSAPDYGPTLERLVERQDALVGGVKRMLQAPAVQMTPESFAAGVERAGELVRRQDRSIIDAAGDRMSDAARQIAGALESARSAAAERDAIIWAVVLSMGGTGALISLAHIVR